MPQIEVVPEQRQSHAKKLASLNSAERRQIPMDVIYRLGRASSRACAASCQTRQSYFRVRTLLTILERKGQFETLVRGRDTLRPTNPITLFLSLSSRRRG